MLLNDFFDLYKNGFCTFSTIEDVLDNMDNSRAVFDVFPYTIKDTKKLEAVDVCYEKYLEGKISLQDFEMQENKIREFLKLLWLYNTVTAQIFFDFDPIMHDVLEDKAKRLWGKVNEGDNLLNVDDLETLEAIIQLGTRKNAYPVLVLPEYRLIIQIDALAGLVIYDDASKLKKLSKIAAHSGIFIDRR